MPKRGDDLLRDDLGRLAELARQFEGDGRGEFAELQVGRNLQRNVLEFEIVLFFQHGAEMRSPSLFCSSRYTSWPQKSLIFKVILAPAVRQARLRRHKLAEDARQHQSQH